jgi:hypothetical protein
MPQPNGKTLLSGRGTPATASPAGPTRSTYSTSPDPASRPHPHPNLRETRMNDVQKAKLTEIRRLLDVLLLRTSS